MGKIEKKHRMLLSFLLLIIFCVMVFTVLYRSNILFVKYAEHGVLVSKLDLDNNYQYEIHIDGRPHSFVTPDKSIDLGPGVINFKYRKNTIVKVLGYVPPIDEKVMSKTSSSIELEYSGFIGLSENINVYKQSGTYINMQSPGSIIVGAENIKLYKDKYDKVRTAVIEGDIDLSFIRVGLKSGGFESFDHEKLEFISDGHLTIQDKKDGKHLSIPPKTLVTLTPVQDGIEVVSDYNNEVLMNRVYIMPQDGNTLTSIQSYERSYGNPGYRGYFEVTQSSGNLNLINEVKLEDYLYQVVPSEMPASFGLEALKAQAVAARTYAISDLLSGVYAERGFHVDDSTMSQVYNNIEENSLASKAINQTRGFVVKYDGSLIDAKYYSTSHGYSADASEIWPSDGVFPGTRAPYLVVKSFLLDDRQFNLSSEEEAAKFFKDWSLKSYDSDSPYFRWKVTMTGNELKNTIEKNLPVTYSEHKNYVLTLVNNKFESRDIPGNCIGELVDMKVSRRGEGGSIMELVIIGTKGTYKVLTELNIRYVLRPRKTDTGSEEDIVINRLSGKPLKNSSLLPSAFMVFDIARDEDDSIKDITFYGGGYGHSVGMSQYGASYLASKDYSFDKILKTYYKDITIEKLY